MDSATAHRFHDALTTGSLTELAIQMRDNGFSQDQVERLFLEFRGIVDGDEAKEDAVLDVLDRIVGYCAFGASLFPPPYYQAYPGILLFFAAPADIREVLRFILNRTTLRVFFATS